MVAVNSDSQYIHAATSENTRLVYQADIDHFLSQGYALPATPERWNVLRVRWCPKQCEALRDYSNYLTRQAILAIFGIHPFFIICHHVICYDE